MRKATDERYFCGEKIAVDVIATPNKENIIIGAGLVFMSGEEKTPGAEKGSDVEFSHKIYDAIEFKNVENLELAQIGLELLQKAISQEQEEQEAPTK